MTIWTHVAVVQAHRRRSFVDLSDELMTAIKDSGTSDGFVIAYCTHTTCALVVNEWETGLLADIAARVAALFPDDCYYAHDDMSVRTQNLIDYERSNGHAHVAQVVIGGTSHAIPIVGGEPAFGTWQRLYLLELDDPKERKIRFHVYG